MPTPRQRPRGLPSAPHIALNARRRRGSTASTNVLNSAFDTNLVSDSLLRSSITIYRAMSQRVVRQRPRVGGYEMLRSESVSMDLQYLFATFSVGLPSSGRAILLQIACDARHVARKQFQR